MKRVVLKKERNQGFTFVELLVVMGLVVVLISVVVSQNRTGAARIMFDDIAYRVALSVRQAQSYGISAREYGEVGGGSRSFCNGYGLHFDLAAPTRYAIFSDPGIVSATFICAGVGGEYDVGDPILETFLLRGGVRLTEVCYWNSVGTKLCNPGITSLDIAFSRPNPEPIIAGDVSNRQACIGLNLSGVGTRSILVRLTGQISIVEGVCPA